jgi:hypothetical protein
MPDEIKPDEIKIEEVFSDEKTLKDVPAKTFSDTQIIKALDEHKEEDSDNVLEKSKTVDIKRVLDNTLSNFNAIFSSSFNVILANTVLSFGQFFSVVVITLWKDCPTIIWGSFLVYCVLAPVFICLLNARLLISLSKRSTGRYTLREF